MINLTLQGASGRMGRALLDQIATAKDLYFVAGIGQNNSTELAAALAQSHAVIDFSTPDATRALIPLARDAGTSLVIGTTGLSAADEAAIQDAARHIPIVYAGNYSLGVNVLATLVQRAAAALPPDLFDLEIFEAHHNQKVDAPSGTALLLGRAGAAGRGVALQDVRVDTRTGHTGPRPAGAIGFSVARGGDVAGDHTVFFYGQQERLELRHQATDRAIFARGALYALRWLMSKNAGLYDMQDVLGLK